MRKWALIIVVIAALLGATLAALSTSQYLRIQHEGFEKESFCVISETINCDVVNASSYSEFLGVPIAWWGLIYYLLLFGMSLYVLLSREDRRATASISWFMSVGGILYSAYLAYISFAVLKVVCIECLGMYLANILLFVFLFISMRMPVGDLPGLVVGYIRALFGKRRDLGFRPRIFSHVVIIGLAFLIGWLVIANIQLRDKKAQEDIDVDQLVKYFYAQSLHQVDVNPEWSVWGNPDAKVTIVEFSEYQCPFCRVSAFNVKPYLHEFKDDLRYYFVNFPLDTACNDELSRQMHPVACFAAKAAICADKRGAFWSFHDELFRNQRKLSRDFILDLAEKRGWNREEFLGCIESPEVESRIKNELAAGRKAFVTGTPTMFLNGRKLRYWRSPEFIREVLRDEIKKSKSSR